MIDTEIIFSEIKDMLVIECQPDQDTTDIASIAEMIIDQKIPAVSVLPESVNVLWTWLEKTPTKIMARFYLNNETKIPEISEKIKMIFKKGASGAQLFMPYFILSSFVSEIAPIRNDLFFNKTLAVCLNVDEINSLDWTEVFIQMKDINADVLLLDFHDELKKDQDFVGRIYGLLQNLENNFGGQFHFSLGNDWEKIEQVWRLIQKIKPEIANRIRFFVNY